jgi:hypothetical protein
MLPDSWTDALFARLTVRYGAAFSRQWPDVDIAAVKADWAKVLARMPAPAIAYALDHLPADKPPNALQFRALCNLWAPGDDKALPAPIYKPTPEQLERLRQARGLGARMAAGAGQ